MRYQKKVICILIGCLICGEICQAVENKSKTKSKSSNKTKSQQQKRLKTAPLVVEDEAWLINVETNIYNNRTFENITLGYSATNGWDFSLSLVNAQILGANKQFQGDTFLNIAKTFTVDESFSIVLGSQNGVALAKVQPRLWYDFSYLDNRYEATPWLLLHGGAYFANAALTGTSNQVGFIAGAEVAFIENQLELHVDYVSGHHALSGATLNLLFNLTPKCQLYLGVYVPEQNSGNDFSGTLGFNFSSKNL